MAKFVALVSWTEAGISDVDRTVERAAAVRELAEQMGGSMESLYWTLGEYDLVATLDFPDDETATAFALVVSKQGNVRTKTMRAFDEQEMQAIVDRAAGPPTSGRTFNRI